MVEGRLTIPPEKGKAEILPHKVRSSEWPHFCRPEMPFWGVSSLPSSNSTQNFFCRSGLVGKGAPLPIMSPRAVFARGLLRSIEGALLHPKTTLWIWGKVGRGSFNPFDSKEEISRYARNDSAVVTTRSGKRLIMLTDYVLKNFWKF